MRPSIRRSLSQALAWQRRLSQPLSTAPLTKQQPLLTCCWLSSWAALCQQVVESAQVRQSYDVLLDCQSFRGSLQQIKFHTLMRTECMMSGQSVVHGHITISADTSELAKHDRPHTDGLLGVLEGQGSSIYTMPCSLRTPYIPPLGLDSCKQPFLGLSQSIEEEPVIVKASTNLCIGLQLHDLKVPQGAINFSAWAKECAWHVSSRNSTLLFGVQQERQQSNESCAPPFHDLYQQLQPWAFESSDVPLPRGPQQQQQQQQQAHLTSTGAYLDSPQAFSIGLQQPQQPQTCGLGAEHLLLGLQHHPQQPYAAEVSMQALCNDVQLDFAHTCQPSAQLFPIDFQLQGLTAQSLAPSAQPCTTHPQQDINWTLEASAQPFPMSPQQVDPRFEENILREQHSMYMGCSPMLTTKKPMQSDPRGPPPKSKRPPLSAHPGALAQHNSLAVSR